MKCSTGGVGGVEVLNLDQDEDEDEDVDVHSLTGRSHGKKLEEQTTEIDKKSRKK